MTWFWTALIATLSWGFADLFYKSGADPEDRRSHLKTTMAVGIAFGLHAAYTLIFGDIGFDWRNLIRYAPVSAMYILSMAIGYLGLRYLELSIVSPVENCSGALAALLGIVILREMPESAFTWIGIVCCCVGVFLLGLFEKGRDAGDLARQDGRKFRTGLGAFLLPLAYCVIDTLGTFLDDPCLDIESTWLLNVTEDTIEDVGNTAYELTFLLVAVIILVYLLATRKKTQARRPALRYPGARALAAVFETVGQYAYAHVIGGSAAVTAPMVGSYCVVSVVLSRLILKEKLPAKQYISIFITFAGILLLGLAEGLAG
jgi:drug/metabolite transporter (DMT)-like permease